MVPCRRIVVWIACYAPFLAAVDSPADEPLSFRVKLDVVQQELNPDFCWFHPRVAAIPAAGQGGKPAIVLTLQKHLRGSDHYSGMYYMRSDNGGKTGTQPVRPPQP